MTIETENGSVVMEAALALLQAGVGIKGRAGLSVRQFMHEVLGIDAEYIEGRISTVFLDSEPLDDIDAATLREGSRLALSAAMPGLVGAVMRRNSHYAAFRTAISHDTNGREATGAAGIESGDPASIFIQVKLFNTVMRECGPAILARGVFVEEPKVRALVESCALPFRREPSENGLILLKVVSEGGPSP